LKKASEQQKNLSTFVVSKIFCGEQDILHRIAMVKYFKPAAIYFVTLNVLKFFLFNCIN
jgi:hypothetical protein